MSKFARRTDGNHRQIINALRSCGVPVQDTSRYPGMLDLLIETRRGLLKRLEIKTGEDEPLTEAEQKVFDLFPRQCHRVWTAEQALEIAFDDR
jgi:hypothetical protein